MKKLLLVLIAITSISAYAQQSSAPQAFEENGVVISKSLRAPTRCKELKEVYVSIHQVGSNYKNLSKAVKEAGGDFVMIQSDSPYYSYKFGGQVYNCNG